MNGSKLSKASNEKHFKPSKHCSDVVKTANKLVGFLERTF